MIELKKMKLEHYSEKLLKKQILEIVSKYLDLKDYRIFFFGSRVDKNNSQRSDIGIEGPDKIPTEILIQIEEELDQLPTLYRFDLVDFKKVSSAFKKAVGSRVEYVS